ncbi:hypothetical protein SCA6_018873 [Theobroma cacao]
MAETRELQSCTSLIFLNHFWPKFDISNQTQGLHGQSTFFLLDTPPRKETEHENTEENERMLRVAREEITTASSCNNSFEYSKALVQETPLGAAYRAWKKSLMGSDLVAPSKARFDPTEPPLLMPEALWCRHLKDPACVVGEQRQFHLPPAGLVPSP